MQTKLQVQNANCTFCMNAVKKELLERPLVNDVRSSATEGCWVVDHDDDPAALIAILNQSLHGWNIATNGEIISVTTDSRISDHCSLH